MRKLRKLGALLSKWRYKYWLLNLYYDLLWLPIQRTAATILRAISATERIPITFFFISEGNATKNTANVNWQNLYCPQKVHLLRYHVQTVLSNYAGVCLHLPITKWTNTIFIFLKHCLTVLDSGRHLYFVYLIMSPVWLLDLLIDFRRRSVLASRYVTRKSFLWSSVEKTLWHLLFCQLLHRALLFVVSALLRRDQQILSRFRTYNRFYKMISIG